MQVEIKGIDELFKKLDELEKIQFPLAFSRALSKTGYDVKDALYKEMQKVFDRPTPYALNSLYVKQARVNDLTAFIYPKDEGGGTPAKKFLYSEIEGGDRHVKRFERALQSRGILPNGMYVTPGLGANLDAYGNISLGQIRQILSYFGSAEMNIGDKANMTDKKKAKLAKGTKSKQGFVYFVSYGKGTWSGRQHLPPGIYKRIGFSWGSAIKPIFLFVKKPSYKSIFKFFEVGQKAAGETFAKNFREAMDEAIRTARLK